MDVDSLSDGALMQSLDFLLWRYTALTPEERERYYVLRDVAQDRGLLERVGFVED